MKKMKYLILQFSLVILSSSVVYSQNIPQKLKVGIIAPLTGGVANWGKSVRTAIELANLDSSAPAELIFADEETCAPNKALTAFHNFKSIQEVNVIIASCLGGAQAIAPLAKKHKIPFFISGRSSSDFQNKNPNALSWISLLDYEGEAITNLIKKREWSRGASMVWSEYFGIEFAKSIKNALEEDKVEFSLESMEIDSSSTPTATEVQRLLKNNPEVIFLMISETSAAYVVKQLKTFKYKGKIVLQSSMLQTYDPAIRSNFRGALQQKFIVNENEFNNLRNRVETTLEESASDDFVFSYDGFSSLLQEADRCKNIKDLNLEDCLIKQMRNEQWRKGVSGSFRFMKDGSTDRPMKFMSITKTGFIESQ